MKNNKPAPRVRMTVKWWNDSKGYGFCVNEAGTEYFAHYTGIYGEGFKTLKEGQAVDVVLIDGPKGLQCSEIYPVLS